MAQSKVTPETVVSLKARFEARDSKLQASYVKILKALGLDIVENYNYAFYSEQQARTKAWWEKRVDGEPPEKTVQINLLHQIVEAQRSVLGASRSLRVPLPTPDDAGQIYADKLEQGIRNLWREWNMPRQQSMVGWYTAVLGNGIGVLAWSDIKKLPMFSVHSPQGFYAQATIDDPTELAAAMFVRKTTGLAVAAEYPELMDEFGGTDELEVIDYYDQNVRMRVLQGYDRALIDEPNTIKRVPVVIFPGILVPGIYGASPMMLAIPIKNELDRLYSLEAEVLQQAVRAPTVINDPINVPENWVWGDEATIEVGPNGKVGKAQLDNIDHNLFFHRIQDMRKALDDVTDFAAMSRGSTEGGVYTGKAVNNLLMPNAQRLENRLQPIDPLFERINEIALLMWQKKGGKKQVPINGRSGKSSFSVQFSPKDDIDPGFVRNYVWLDTARMFDKQSNLVNILQALRSNTPSQQAISQRRAIELLPFAEDTMGEVSQIWNEYTKAKQDEAAQAQAAQAAVAGAAGGPAGPPPGAPSQQEIGNAAIKGGSPGDGMQLPSGGPQGTAPSGAEMPQAPGELPGVGAPAEPPVSETVLPDVAEHFRGIENIHGQVYLCGGVLQNRLDLGIEVFLTDMTDKATIVNSFKNDPELGVIATNNDLHFRAEPPSTPILEVTPGTNGVEPAPYEPEPAPAPPGGAPSGPPGAGPSGPPNLAALMGGGPAG